MLPEAEKLQFLQKTELFAELPQTELKAICHIANEGRVSSLFNAL